MIPLVLRIKKIWTPQIPSSADSGYSLNTQPLAKLGGEVEKMQLDLRVRKPGTYALILNYVTPSGGPASSVYVETDTQSGRAIINDCRYGLYFLSITL